VRGGSVGPVAAEDIAAGGGGAVAGDPGGMRVTGAEEARAIDLFAIPTSPRSCAALYSSARAATQPAALLHGTVMWGRLCHQGSCGLSLGRFGLDLIFTLGLAGSGSSATGGALNPRTGDATNPNSPTLRGVFATV
jgi:hypothetical protein